MTKHLAVLEVTFEIEPAGSAVKLTVTHDVFEPDSEMLMGIKDGWPAILSNLKSLLETDEIVSHPSDDAKKDG